MGIDKSQEKPRASEPLSAIHELQDFNSGNATLDDWIKRRALKNEQSGASRTYVVCIGQRVIAYYCLAAGSVVNASAPNRVRRNMPDPIPVAIIGRLAVDCEWQHRGIGKALVRDAILRTLQAAEIIGIRAILAHAISEQAQHFYEKCGFTASPIASMTLMVTIADARAALGE